MMPADIHPSRQRELLARLPQFDPDPRLWARIEELHRRQLHARRVAWRWLSSGIAAALVAVIVLPRGSEQRVDDLASWQQRSQALEREWLARTHAADDAQLPRTPSLLIPAAAATRRRTRISPAATTAPCTLAFYLHAARRKPACQDRSPADNALTTADIRLVQSSLIIALRV